MDRGCEFSFFQGIHVRIDIRMDSSISIRPVTTEFCMQVRLEELTQMRLVTQIRVTSSRKYHVTLKRCFNFLSARAMIIKFGQDNYKKVQLPLMKSHDPSITSSSVTGHVKH